MRNSDYVVVIPCYNEEETIREVVERSRKYADVCVIDDCSTDSSSEILKSIDGIHIIRHPMNTHIARAILDGMAYAAEKGYEYCITMDAGLSHNPDEIPLFINHDDCDLVFGRRDVKTATPLFRRSLSAIGNLVYNVFLDFPRLIPRPFYKDLTTGYRRYSNRAMKHLLSTPMKSKSFDFIFESSMHLYKAGMTFSEVPITYNFTNSSFNSRALTDCLKMVFKSVYEK